MFSLSPEKRSIADEPFDFQSIGATIGNDTVKRTEEYASKREGHSFNEVETHQLFRLLKADSVEEFDPGLPRQIGA